ncbi:MAG TPA: c-type cytochrome domain-containing protein, partial [Planctomycetota bacterium]|nr:c-type cytochrome domain-containing protein [Planctomycetota bacterium]
MRTFLWIGASLLLLPGAWGQDKPARPADPKAADAQVRALLTKHCLECHGAEKTKGKFRVDQLDFAFAGRTAHERWQA